MEFLKRTIATEDTRPRERFIEFYFEFGLNCDVIKSELYLRERHLKRVLTVRENTRGKACPDLVAWVTFISNHLQCSGQLHFVETLDFSNVPCGSDAEVQFTCLSLPAFALVARCLRYSAVLLPEH